MATDTTPVTGTGRTGITRPVLLAGIALGTCLTILTMWNGARLRVPDLPSILSAALGALIVWVLFMAVAAVLSELTVRHHRAALAHGWRHGKRGGAAAVGWSRRAAQGAAVRSRPWRTRIITAMRTRWGARAAEPLLFRGKASPDGPSAGEEPGNSPAGPAEGPTYSWGPADSPSGWPADDAETAHRWAQHMSTDGGKPQVVTEYPPGGGPGRTVATYINGKPVQPSTEGTTMGIVNQDDREEKARERDRKVMWAAHGVDIGNGTRQPAAARVRGSAGGGGCSPAWKTLTAETGDFEPEDDGHLMSWMASEVNGMSAYAEAITDVYETAVSGVGLDPVSMAALHDYADAAAEAAQAMAAARQKFASHYQEVREFAAAGGLLPHDGRWITGEGE